MGSSPTFAALQERPYRLLWTGGIMSFLSVQMQMIARGWLAHDLSGSNKGLGIVYLGFGVPMLLLSPWGGVAADRFPKRTVIIGCQLVLAISALLVAVPLALGVAQFWMLVVSAMVQAAGFSFLGPSRMAFTSDLVGHRRLGNAIVLQQLSMNGTRVFGPALAGALLGVAYFGAAGVYFLTTGLMLAATTTTLRLPEGRPTGLVSTKAPLRDFADGLAYVQRNRRIRLMLLTSFAVLMIGFPYMAFLPTLADEEFATGASGYGVMSGATAIGALAASLFIASRADGPRALRLQAIAGVVFGASVVLAGVAPTYALALVVLVVCGGASSAYQSLNNALILSESDPAFHGRLQSLMMLGFSGFGIAALPLGAAADAVGIRTTFVTMGVVVVAVMAVYIVVSGRLRPALAAAAAT